ncbi:alpha/beta fold hydrolase [Actinotalea sp. Marseille-Q4924]|uniref:alpha/beta fold hydrolase n=1 Tax=Actinotalea sp. Marseille-Q4924 TaxID=2866571 RepID=UPI001CE3CC8F|nr:alpha/beta hydrolase [Actinotalea sp. Marseille-Q4924]
MTTVEVWGSGQRVVLVHGSVATGPTEWQGQRVLADAGYELVVPTRRAYAETPVTRGEDVVGDAAEIADLLGDGGHLVGHSSGGLVALLAAAARPDAVRSLVVAEPPAFSLAEHEPAVARLRADVEPLFSEAMSDRAFLEEFLPAVGSPVDELPTTVLEEWERLVPALRRGTLMWDVVVPVQALADAPFRIVVVSGGHHPGFTAMCTHLAQAVGGEHVVRPGAGHEVQEAPGFTDLLRRVWNGRPTDSPI